MRQRRFWKKNEKEKDQQAALTNGGFKFYFCIQPKRYLVLFSIFALVIMPVVLLLLPHRRSYHFLLIATFRVIYNKTRSQTEHTYTHKLETERETSKHPGNGKRKQMQILTSSMGDLVPLLPLVATTNLLPTTASCCQNINVKTIVYRQNVKIYFDQKLRFISANCHNDGGR